MGSLMGTKQKRPVRGVVACYLAETKGFEPLIQVLPGCSLSRGVPSTSRPRLQKGAMIAFPLLSVKPKEELLALVESERLVQNADSQLKILFFNDNRNLDFGRGDHLNVDSFRA